MHLKCAQSPSVVHVFHLIKVEFQSFSEKRLSRVKVFQVLECFHDHHYCVVSCNDEHMKSRGQNNR